MYLERLARTYWKFLSRVSLGLIRVEYTDTERRVVLLRRPFVLLRFRAPEYEISDGRGIVRWRIRDGVLVAKRDQGYLEIDVRKGEADRPGYEQAHVEVEVANFYPAIATWVARWLYKVTQSRIHVLVTHGFLRSLARRELEDVGGRAVRRPGRAARQRRRHAVGGRRRRWSRPPPRPATPWSGLSVAGGELAQLRAVVARLDAPHRARAAAHHERLGARPARARVADALEHVAVGHAGGREEAVVAAHEVVLREHAVDVVAGVGGRLALVVVTRPQAPDQAAADST